MAIDPRISLAASTRDVITPALNMFENTLNARSNRAAQQQNIAQSQQQMNQLEIMNPLLAQEGQQNIDINTQNIATARNESRFKNIFQTSQMLKPFIANNDAAGAEQFMLKNISRLQDAKARGEDVDLTESLETLEQIKAGNLQGVAQNITAIEGIAQQRMNKGMSAGQREFQYHMGVYNDPKSDTKTKLASGVFLGLDPRAGSSAAERTANDLEGLGKNIATQAGNVAEAEEDAKLKSKLKWQPQITKAVKLAEKAATERGDVLNDLARAEAGLPGLIKATESLKELAVVATSTYGGRLFNAIAKESGWGSTKGGDARAKYIAIIDNQVLPLLKQTFGGAMTEGEGLRLSNTLGDPNATPEQKMLQTEAFIEQKLRDIEGLKAQAQKSQPGVVVPSNNEFSGFKVIR